MKILLDESQASEAAIREVEERFGSSGTNVRVLHVTGSFVPPAAALLGVGSDLEAARQEVVSRYQLLLEGVA